MEIEKLLEDRDERIAALERDALIEAALERVRSASMAMHKSDELSETAGILFQEFGKLELLPQDARIYFSLIEDPDKPRIKHQNR